MGHHGEALNPPHPPPPTHKITRLMCLAFPFLCCSMEECEALCTQLAIIPNAHTLSLSLSLSLRIDVFPVFQYGGVRGAVHAVSHHPQHTHSLSLSLSLSLSGLMCFV